VVLGIQYIPREIDNICCLIHRHVISACNSSAAVHPMQFKCRSASNASLPACKLAISQMATGASRVFICYLALFSAI